MEFEYFHQEAGLLIIFSKNKGVIINIIYTLYDFLDSINNQKRPKFIASIYKK